MNRPQISQMTAEKSQGNNSSIALAEPAKSASSAQSVDCSIARNGSHPVALIDMDVPQLTAAYRSLDECQARYDKLSGIVATMKGIVLTEVKHKCGHGNFLPWLRENFPKSHKTATQDMRLAAEFFKCEPRFTFETLGRDLAATLREIEAAQLDLSHPLVREVAGFVGERTRYQLLLDFPGERGGDTGGRRKKCLNKSPEEIAREEAQTFWFPFQHKCFALLQDAPKKRLLWLPIASSPEEASLITLERELGDLHALVKEALAQRKRAAKQHA